MGDQFVKYILAPCCTTVMGDSQETGAILTPSQREFLRGSSNEELSDANMRMKRARITDRIQTSITEDIRLITEAIATENKPNSLSGEKIVEGVDKDDFQDGLALLVALIDVLSTELGVNVDDVLIEGFDKELQPREEKLREKARNDPESMTVGELRDLKSFFDGVEHVTEGENQIDQMSEEARKIIEETSDNSIDILPTEDSEKDANSDES